MRTHLRFGGAGQPGLLPVVVVAVLTLVLTHDVPAQQGGAVRTTLSRATTLEQLQRATSASPSTALLARRRLLRDAAKHAKQPMVAVTDKRALLPPSGDAHDYLSLSPYWWPDSTVPGGLPYVRNDGVTNPESKRDLDQPRVSALGERVEAFTLAWWITGDRQWSALAAKQLRTWFLDPATRMTPNLRYAQLIRGRSQVRGTGIIDGRPFMEVTDMAGLLSRSPDWSATDDAALHAWFTEYLAWLKTSEQGQMEHMAPNNHGSWFAAQAAAVALFVGDSAYVRDLAAETKARIDRQITSEGVQPEEMERTRSMHYSAFNIEALSRIAEVGRHVGVDLWQFEGESGGSLVKAIDHVAAYVGKESDWPGPQIDPVSQSNLITILCRARLATGRAGLDAALGRLSKADVDADRAQLLFWRGS